MMLEKADVLPFESVTVRVPVDGLNPLPAGQLMVNVPLKFSAFLSAEPDSAQRPSPPNTANALIPASCPTNLHTSVPVAKSHTRPVPS